MIPLEPVPIAVTFVSNGTETFSIKWSVPTRNHSSVPQGVTLSCSNANPQNIILNTNITHTDTTLQLDMNRTVMCCVSAPNIKTKCVTYNPNVNDPGIAVSNILTQLHDIVPHKLSGEL